MKTILFALLLSPLFSMAQRSQSKYENDTLFTSCGFKIYKGQTLYFGKGTNQNGTFRYINIKSQATSFSLTNNSIVVKKLKNYGISVLGNGYIEIVGSIVYKDGSKGWIDIHMAFDRAIENNPNLPSELTVPAEYRGKDLGSTAQEIERLNKLYKDGVITKEEFEAQKKKLLEQ